MNNKLFKRILACLLVISLVLSSDGTSRILQAKSVVKQVNETVVKDVEDETTEAETIKSAEEETVDKENSIAVPEKNDHFVNDETVLEDTELPSIREEVDTSFIDLMKASDGGTELPVNADGTLGDISAGTTYTIMTFTQWNALAQYSKKHDLAGYTFTFSLNYSSNTNGSTIYDFTGLQESFQGLGSAMYPFAGSLSSSYTAGTISFKMNTPLFSYLSSEATVSGIRIEACGTTAGLADYLIVDETSMNPVYSNITVFEDSTDAGVTGDVVGGMFAHVVNESDTPFTMNGNNVLVKTAVSGNVAGGLIGELKGNTILNLSGIRMGDDTGNADVGATPSTAEAVGGVIGIVSPIDGAASNSSLSVTSDSSFNFTHRTTDFKNSAQNSGGFFGKIHNTDITVNCPMVYTGGTASKEIVGKNVGVFAGSITNSTITLNNQITCDNVTICLPATEDAVYGNAGLFAGKLDGTNIQIGSQCPGAVYGFYANYMNKRDSINDLSKSNSSNVGGFAGCVRNANIEFTGTNPCVIENLRTSNTRGNVSAGIGWLETDNQAESVQYIKIVGTETRLSCNNAAKDSSTPISQKGTLGGIAGYVSIKGSDVTISNCEVTPTTFRVVAYPIPYMSLGIGAVESVKNSNHKIILNNLTCKTTFADESHSKHFSSEAFGGLIGLAASDFEISGDNKAILSGGNIFGCSSCGPQYYGGAIGEVVNLNEQQTRKGVMSNIEVGRCPFGYTRKGKGGFVGFVGSNCAIALTGTLTDTVTDKNQVTWNDDLVCGMGSVVGVVDNGLVFMEPGASITHGTHSPGNEIGNAGGIIRNRNWDSDDENGSKLIEDYQVTGTLSTEINTVGDLMRLAIAMNTQGIFVPLGNTTVLNDIDEIRKATYQLSADDYDLTKTGMVCLSRNDNKGITETPFEGSLIGKNSKSTIQYEITNSNQQYIGLFPKVVSDESGSRFENLHLKYSVKYTTYSAKNYSWGGNPCESILASKEYAGGLCAIASGNVTVDNVSYEGGVTDVSNSKWDNTNKKYVTGSNKGKEDDYLGGLIGTYIAQGGKTLVMGDVSAYMSHTYMDFSHVTGGLVGYVDLSGVTADNPCEIKIGSESKPVSLEGKMDASVSIPTGVDSLAYSLRTGGLIGEIGKGNSYSSFASKCKLTVKNLDIEGLSITSGGTEYKDIGGFLGYRFKDVDATINTVKVGTKAETKIDAKASFGGLVHAVCGTMLVDNIKIGSKTQFSTKNATNADQCGLLIRDGRYVYLDVRTYEVQQGIKLLNYQGKTFDEIAGFTKGGDDDNHGGIVTIGSNDANYYLGRNDSPYKSYESGHIVDASGAVWKPTGNSNTRYYYDLNKTDWSQGVNATLTDAEDVLRWNVLHYANAGIRKLICTSYSSIPKTYTVPGTINLKGYSIYPLSVQNETYTGTGTIQFDAQSIITGETANMSGNNNLQKYPEDGTSQHYQMQAGLFDNVSGLKVDGITLAGTYSKLCPLADTSRAGALVVGRIYGIENGTDANGKTLYNTTITNTFKDITLKNLWCVSKDAINYDAPIGLMIGDIASGAQVSFDGIVMSGYSDDDVAAGKKAASALVGNVGGSDATYIALSFKNMDIADAAATKSSSALHSSTKDEALAMASFIYSYDYMENCNGIYTFTYEDYRDGRCISPATKRVTLGLELGNNGGTPNYALEEYFDEDMPVGQMKASDRGITFDCENYIPYVCTGSKHILVNPKAGNLDTGCGTYEDPYVISSTKQLISLYRYLYDEENFVDVLKAGPWKVNPVGDDSKFCDGTTNEDTGHGDAKAYGSGDAGFPTKEMLSQAYYIITNDIDLSGYSEFIGFGRRENPFVGVFVGKQKGNSDYPVIILSKLSNPVESYGFIQVAKGCVVKDLTMQFNQPVQINKVITDEENGTSKNEGGAGGGVIGTVLGGENIIDHVTVQGNITESGKYVECFTPVNTKAQIGGYVGAVNAGGVIMRNLGMESLSKFNVSLQGTTPISDYWYTCTMVGRVYDGYVVYDSSTADTNTPLFKDLSDVYQNGYEIGLQNGQSRSYDILNGNHLKANSEQIVWSGTGFTIPDAGMLQVISMGLNSGMFNYDTSKTDTIGYNQVSRQRSGNYDYVGNVGASDEGISARADAICYDNMNKASVMKYHSYLSQYFDWNENPILSGNTSFDGTNGTAILNSTDAVLTYTLTGETYDMSVYGKAFRGFGARYKIHNNYFHSNFVGKEGQSQIKLDMYVDGIQDAEDVALFNKITLSSLQTLSVQNITLTGSVINKSDVGDAFSGLVTQHYASGIVTRAQNVNVNFDSVIIDKLQVKSQNYAGSMVGYNKGGEITFTNCGITGEAQTDEMDENSVFTKAESTAVKQTVIVGRSDTGGLIGKTETKITVQDLKMLDHLYVVSYAEDESHNSVGGDAGGLIGDATTPVINGKINESQPFGEKITVLTNGNNCGVGGLVGQTQAGNSTFKDIVLTDLTVKNIFQGPHSDIKDLIGIAGIVGSAGGEVNLINITVGSSDPNQKVEIRHMDKYVQNNGKYQTLNIFGTGGLIGRHNSKGTLTLTDCRVLGYKGADGYTTVISGQGSNVAGIAGNAYKVNGTGIMVDCVSIEATRYASGVISWYEQGNGATLEDVSVNNVKIVLSGNCDDRGNVGGIAATLDEELILRGARVDSLIIESDYCNNTGGFVGLTKDRKITIESYEKDGTVIPNSIKNSYLGGFTVGGAVGSLTKSQHQLKDITIANNKLISCRDDGSSSDTMRAGGLVGYVYGDNANHTLFSKNIDITDNLISAYDAKADLKRLAKIGGVIGQTQYEAHYSHVTLHDNYIGMMKRDELKSSQEGSGTAADRKAFILNTPIAGENGLRDYLYFVTSKTKSMEKKICDAIDVDTEGVPEYYKYSYYQGAVVGLVDNKVDSGNVGISKFVDVHISYSEPKYRPVADVGTSTQSFTSNMQMNVEQREKCAIVYDGRMTEAETVLLEDYFTGLSSAELGNHPYVFSNLEELMRYYQTANEPNMRMSYWLKDNYQNGRLINQDTTVLNYDKITVENVCENTYKKGDTYKSPFKKGENALPMIVYNSAESGTLDQVIHTYINILTNNTGGLNSYVNYSKNKSITVLDVKAYKMKLSNGQVCVDTSQDVSPSVVVSPTQGGSNVKYSFTAGPGDDYVSETEGTFSIVHVEYGWKNGNKKEVQWVLDIPVYVEKRLKVYSNMKMMEGIRYHTETIKTNGVSVATDATDPQFTSMTKGNSYSIYSEYIYVDSEKFSSVTIPKSFCIKTKNNVDIGFMPGTKITLVALDEGSKAYYYNVESGVKQIDFTSFKDMDGNPYNLKDVKTYEYRKPYTDVCNVDYNSDVVVERFVLFVDTSDVENSINEQNKLYELHITPENIQESLKNRTDYYEHCYEYINEIPGASYEINDDTTKTYLDPSSSVREDGWIKVNLQYEIKASVDFWRAIHNSTEMKYADVGFYLVAQNSDNTQERILLPTGTSIFLGSGEERISIPTTDRQSTVYYYQGRRKQTGSESDMICLNQLNGNVSNTIEVSFDFANADLNELSAYKDKSIYLVADLVITEDKDLPAAGEVKDTWQSAVSMEAKDDIGFSLEVEDIKTLGMNQFNPEVSDSGVVSYTANIAFPESDAANMTSKDYTILYEIEEKTSQSDANGKPVYQTYTGDEVSLYLGEFASVDAAKQAATQADSVRSGKGITAVTYHFDEGNVNTIKASGMVLRDGTGQASPASGTPGVLKSYCTLVANCENLNMTNYRVKAYLVVEDASGETNQQGCMKKATVRNTAWTGVSGLDGEMKQKNDCFIFTVAKIKTNLN